MTDVRRVQRSAAAGGSRRTPSAARRLAAILVALVLLPALPGVAQAQRAEYFTRALPAGAPVAGAAKAAGAAARVTRVTLRSPQRFSLAALRWTGTAPLDGRVRAKRTGGSWTRWTELDPETPGLDGTAELGAARAVAARRNAGAAAKESTTDPLWTGPARVLQVELRGKRPKGLRAAFVDVRGKVPAATARAARRQDGQAGIQPRAAWDPNNECKPRSSPAIGQMQGVVVHHTAGSNAYSRQQVPAVVLAICKYHRNSNGWNDVGYNVLVDKYGGAWEGRAGGLDKGVIGAHAQGFNSVTAGISILGDYSSVGPPADALSTVARVAAWKLAASGAPLSGEVALRSAGGGQSKFGSGRTVTMPRVLAHRDVGRTACPGNAGYAQMDAIRDAVATANPLVTPISGPITTPQAPTLSISTKRRVRAGTASVVAGTVKRGASVLKGATVALQVRTGADRWMTVETRKTDSKGKYRFSRKFSRTWEMRVIRNGGDGGTSKAVNVVLVAKLGLQVPKRLTVGRRTKLTGTISPGRGDVILQVERRSPSGRWVKSDDVPATRSGRRVSVNVTPHAPTQYRFRLVYRGSSALTAPARSSLRYVKAYRPGSRAGGASITG